MNESNGVKLGEMELFSQGYNVGRSQITEKKDVEKLLGIDVLNAETFNRAPKEKRLVKRLGETLIEFEILKLRDEYDPSLTVPTVSWDFDIDSVDDLRYICISMVETMTKHGGVGLAANQVGLPYSIFVMGAGGYVTAIVNPKIIQADGEEVIKEGCLSYPGLYLNIKRANHIVVEFYDMNGVFQQRTFEGLTARIFLHEYDHLQGTVFTSLVPKVTLQRERDKRKSNLKKIKRAKDLNQRQQKIAELSKKVNDVRIATQQNKIVTIPDNVVQTMPTGTIDLSTLK